MQVMKPLLVLSKVPDYLKIATEEDEFREVWKLREVEFTKLYPCVTHFKDDVYDGNACVLYSQNEDGEFISTARVAFDGSLGLPADALVKDEIDKLRRQGTKVAEPGKFAIAREARGMLPAYLRTYYEIALGYGVDSLVFILRDKNVGFYEKIVDANVLLPDIGHSYGTQFTFALLEWKVKKSRPYLAAWLGEELP